MDVGLKLRIEASGGDTNGESRHPKGMKPMGVDMTPGGKYDAK